MELDKLKAEKNASFLYAGMDGIVYSMEDYLEGSTSEKDKVVMTIIDNSECLFTTSNPDNVQYYKEGMLIPMTITSSSAAGEYQITPWHMDEWDEEQYFSVVSGPDGSSIEVGTNGYMKVVMASKEQVLSIPKEALNYAGDKYYVYVIGENNMREVQWVEIGVYGDTRVEIINGLSEGDKVISR